MITLYYIHDRVFMAAVFHDEPQESEASLP
jgi:hypothetical protein